MCWIGKRRKSILNGLKKYILDSAVLDILPLSMLSGRKEGILKCPVVYVNT